MKTCGHADAVIDFGNLRLCVACANSDEYARRRRAFRRRMGSALNPERAAERLKLAQHQHDIGNDTATRAIADDIAVSALEEAALGFHSIAQELAKVALEARKLTQTI